MNDQQLRSLLAAVECGSFSRAEEHLFLSKQALKKQIDTLEDELGFSLINRNRQGITLTPAGSEFCAEIKNILERMDALTLKCKSIAFADKTIRIENPYHSRLLLETAFDEFSHRYPSVKIHILLQHADRIADDILNDCADIAECSYRPTYEQKGLVCQKLFPISYKCLVNSSHPLAAKKELELSDLNGSTVYVHQSNTSVINELKENCSNLNLNLLPHNNPEIIQNICYNHGIFISKAYFLSFMQPLVALPLHTQDVPMAAVLYRENPPETVKEFIRVITDVYSLP